MTTHTPDPRITVHPDAMGVDAAFAALRYWLEDCDHGMSYTGGIPLPSSDGGRKATADEFMLMDREAIACGYPAIAFKHRDSRNYLFLLWRETSDLGVIWMLWYPHEDKPFRRGLFDVSPEPEPEPEPETYDADLATLEAFAKAEGLEAKDVAGLVEMASWDLGYQDSDLPGYLRRLGEATGIDVEREHKRGRICGAVDRRDLDEGVAEARLAALDEQGRGYPDPSGLTADQLLDLCAAINRYGDGCHPHASLETFKSFACEYVEECAGRALASESLDESTKARVNGALTAFVCSAAE